MAEVKIRAASIYAGGTKIGEASGSTYEINGGDEAQFGDPGYLGHSEGAITSKLSFNAIIPVPGMKVDLVSKMLKKETVNMAMGLVNGKIHRVPMRIVQAQVTSEHRNGTQNGSFSLEGGEPEVTG